MTARLNLSDVPQVEASDLDMPMRLLISRGQGLAFLKGLTENEIREVEAEIWSSFEGTADARLAVALRFRALIDVFGARRLKDLFLSRGYKLIAAAIAEAASQRLNVRFGFNAQKLLLALEAATAPVAVAQPAEFRLAA